MREAEPVVFAMRLGVDVEDVPRLRRAIVESLGKPVAECPKGREELWVLDAAMLRLDHHGATLFSDGPTCP
jgi:hypothetical protein